jgi:hypothetical protein
VAATLAALKGLVLKGCIVTGDACIAIRPWPPRCAPGAPITP